MIKIKRGVVIAGLRTVNLLYPVHVADKLWHRKGWGHVTLTAGIDGEHANRSYHYVGLGSDIRFPLWPNWAFPHNQTAVRILRRLLPNFRIIHEKTHIHIEPKRGRGLEIFKAIN